VVADESPGAGYQDSTLVLHLGSVLFVQYKARSISFRSPTKKPEIPELH
jgi:hypothetical protein